MTSPAASKTGTTSSDLDRASQAMWPGKDETSATTTLRRSAAARPQTPRPGAMVRQPGVPW
jgi:hypothetical protein